MKNRLAVIGAGAVVNFHLSACVEAGFEIVSICSAHNGRNVKELSDLYNISNIRRDWKSLIMADDEYDAVLVCTPTLVSEKIILSKLQISKYVLVEKPGFYLESFRSKNLTDYDNIFIAYNRKFYETVQKFKSLTANKSGLIEVSVVEKFTTLDDFDIVHENAIHLFDIIKYTFGKYNLIHSFKIADSRTYVLTFNFEDNGNILILRLLFNSPTNTEIIFTSDKFKIELKPLETLRFYDYMKVNEPSLTKPFRTYEPVCEELGEALFLEEESKFKPGFLEQAAAFFNLVNNNYDSELHKLTKLADSLFSLSVADQILRILKDYEK